MPTFDRKKPARVLLVEANNMNKWVGTTMPYEMHVPPLGLMYLASYARTALPEIEFRIVESSLSCPDDERFIRILNEFQPDVRSEEERRVGKECRSRRSPHPYK